MVEATIATMSRTAAAIPQRMTCTLPPFKQRVSRYRKLPDPHPGEGPPHPPGPLPPRPPSVPRSDMEQRELCRNFQVPQRRFLEGSEGWGPSGGFGDPSGVWEGSEGWRV